MNSPVAARPSALRRALPPSPAADPRSLRNFWVGVTSVDHVERARAGGFVQINHGKASPLERMRVGDGFAFYSPRAAYPDGAVVQAFTALAVVCGATITQADMGGASCRFAAPSAFSMRAPRRSVRSSTLCRSSTARRTGAPRSGSAFCAFPRTISPASPP